MKHLLNFLALKSG